MLVGVLLGNLTGTLFKIEIPREVIVGLALQLESDEVLTLGVSLSTEPFTNASRNGIGSYECPWSARSRIKLGNILVEEHLNGLLATPISKITHAQCIVRAQIAPESST